MTYNVFRGMLILLNPIQCICSWFYFGLPSNVNADFFLQIMENLRDCTSFLYYCMARKISYNTVQCNRVHATMPSWYKPTQPICSRTSRRICSLEVKATAPL